MSDFHRRLSLVAIVLVISTSLLAQSIAELDLPNKAARPYWLAAGHDGAMWFTMPGTRSIGRIRPDGTMTAVGTFAPPQLLTLLNDGSLWFTTSNTPNLGVIAPNGAMSKVVGNSDSSSLRGITFDARFVWVTT